MKLPAFLLLQTLLCVTLGAADGGRIADPNFNSWWNYFGDHPLGKSKWGVHLEGQWRRTGGITDWQQLLLRPGINYQIHPRVMLSAGYAFIETYRYGNYPAASAFPEHRIWQQAQIRSNTGKLVWSTRLRFEERYIGVIANGALQRYRYENRFRALQRVTVPTKGKLYFTAYDELFFYINPYVSASVLDQNRAYVALGWKWKPGWNIETGYMHQTLLQRNGLIREDNNTIMVSIISNAPFGRK